MKKMIAVFPIIVLLIMGNMVGMRAHALTFGEIMTEIEGVPVDSGIDLRELEMGPEDYISILEIDKSLYVWFQDEYYREDDNYGFYSYFTCFDEDVITDVGYNEVELCYYINFNSRPSIYRSYFYSDIVDGFVTSTGGYIKNITTKSSNSYSLSFNQIKYYPENETTEVYLDDELIATYNSKFIESNVEDFYSSGLDLTVSFTPTLSGEVNRTIEQNGVQAESNYFSMEIVNNSAKGVQFLMAITPKDNPINFIMSDKMLEVGLGYDSSSEITYLLLYPEWNICFDSFVSSSHQSVFHQYRYKEQYTSSSWHYIDGKETYKRSFSWSQINVEKGKEYEVLVYAVANDYDVASKQFTVPTGDNYINTADIELVYSSVFTVSNPAKLDINDKSFGNTPYNPYTNLIQTNWSSSAYKDPITGEIIIDNKNIDDYMAAAQDKAASDIIYKSDNYTSYSFDSYVTTSKSFFKFLSAGFSLMPEWYWGTISVGVFLIITIGVIKALR